MFKLDRDECFAWLGVARVLGILALVTEILRFGADAYVPPRGEENAKMHYIDERLLILAIVVMAIGAIFLIVRRHRIQKAQDEMRKLHGKDWH